MISPTPEQWRNLVLWAKRHDLPVLRVTPAQHRRIKLIRWDPPFSYQPQHTPWTGDSATLYGLPLEDVPEGFGIDLATAVDRALLGPPRIRQED